jgi:hypothetical protein
MNVWLKGELEGSTFGWNVADVDFWRVWANLFPARHTVSEKVLDQIRIVTRSGVDKASSGWPSLQWASRIRIMHLSGNGCARLGNAQAALFKRPDL